MKRSWTLPTGLRSAAALAEDCGVVKNGLVHLYSQLRGQILQGAIRPHDGDCDGSLHSGGFIGSLARHRIRAGAGMASIGAHDAVRNKTARWMSKRMALQVRQ